MASPLLSFILGLIIGGIIGMLALGCLAGSRGNIDETHADESCGNSNTIHFSPDDMP